MTVVYLDEHPRQVQIGLLLNQNDTVKELRQTLAADTKIPEFQVISILNESYLIGFALRNTTYMHTVLSRVDNMSIVLIELT